MRPRARASEAAARAGTILHGFIIAGSKDAIAGSKNAASAHAFAERPVTNAEHRYRYKPWRRDFKNAQATRRRSSSTFKCHASSVDEQEVDRLGRSAAACPVRQST